MSAFTQFAQYLPAALCLFWLVFHAFAASRCNTFGLVFLQMMNLVLFHLFPFEPLYYFTGAVVLPLSYLYLEQLRVGNASRIRSAIWLTVPVALLTAGIVLDLLSTYYHIDIQDGRRVLDLVYFWTLVLEALAFIFYLALLLMRYKRRPFAATIRFFSGKSTVAQLDLQLVVSLVSVPLVALFYFDILSGVWLTILQIAMSADLFFFGYAALFGSDQAIERDRFFSIMGLMIEKEPLDSRGTEGVGYQPHAARLFKDVTHKEEADSLLSAFQHLMTDGQLFLKPGLTLDEVARCLGTNKTYVSKLVNKTYNVGFPELLNILRVDYAEQYLFSHRDARQADVARASGFPNASSFNSTFKRITGFTPKMWLASYSHQALRRDTPDVP